MYEIISIAITILSTAISAVFLNFFQRQLGKKKAVSEDKEIEDEVKKVFISFNESKKDVLALMVKNVAELREYYVINKQQSRNAFSAALFISILGFLLFASGVIIAYIDKQQNNIIPYSTVSGTIVELIAGLFFWIYSKATKQINIFHTSLQKTEKFLTAIQLVDKVSSEKKDDIYKEIISKIIDSNFDNKNETSSS
ncbi:MAG: TRADD-N-associated membrane domain-containing protein [Spirosomataceae bacterium]